MSDHSLPTEWYDNCITKNLEKVGGGDFFVCFTFDTIEIDIKLMTNKRNFSNGGFVVRQSFFLFVDLIILAFSDSSYY